MLSPTNRLEALRVRGGIVKICGIREAAHAIDAATAGADVLGVVFARSRRQLTPEQAASLVDSVRRELGERTPLFAGVFVDESPERVNDIARHVGLDVVQLHGAESVDTLANISLPVVRAIGPAPGTSDVALVERLNTMQFDKARPALWLIDAFDPVNHGGSGHRADWSLAAAIAPLFPMMLAGGLDADNVADAIRAVRPIGVDVSSGVESGGVKDPARIRSFVTAARAAFADA